MSNSDIPARSIIMLSGPIVAPRMFLIIGRSLGPDLTAEVRRTHQSSAVNDISLITYDELASPLWHRVRGLKERLLKQTADL